MVSFTIVLGAGVDSVAPRLSQSSLRGTTNRAVQNVARSGEFFLLFH